MMEILPILQLIRPKHWIKNAAVLLPILSALKFNDPDNILQISLAFIAFCLISSVVYILNDIHDRESDRLFIHTHHRPLASKRITVSTALIIASLFALAAFLTAALVSMGVLWIILGYFLLQITYTWHLKQKVLLDVICIALGFILRAAAGAASIHVALSPWLFICMFTLCLFMGFCKRYMERMNLENPTDSFQNHRPILLAYPQELLMHLISVSAGIAILAFLMYSISASTVAQFGTHYIVYTLPIQIYCIFRFTLLSMQATYASPVDVLMADRPLQIASCLFITSVGIIMIWGAAIQKHIHIIFLS